MHVISYLIISSNFKLIDDLLFFYSFLFFSVEKENKDIGFYFLLGSNYFSYVIFFLIFLEFSDLIFLFVFLMGNYLKT